MNISDTVFDGVSQDAKVHFTESAVADERGDVVSITYDPSNTDESYIVIGDKIETNYAIIVDCREALPNAVGHEGSPEAAHVIARCHSPEVEDCVRVRFQHRFVAHRTPEPVPTFHAAMNAAVRTKSSPNVGGSLLRHRRLSRTPRKRHLPLGTFPGDSGRLSRASSAPVSLRQVIGPTGAVLCLACGVCD